MKAVIKEAFIELEKEKEEMTFAISTASIIRTKAVLRKLGVFTLKEKSTEISTTTSIPIFEPFDWVGMTEPSKIQEAIQHIENQLSAFGVAFGKGGYHLVDTHSQNILTFEDSKIGKFRGGTDAVVVPFNTSESDPSRQLCVLFQLKTKDFDKHLPQSTMELIAARCLSEQPEVLVVLTDLTTGAHCSRFSFVVEEDAENKSSSNTTKFVIYEKRLILSDMGSFVADFLRSSTIPNALFQAERPEGPNRGVFEFKRQKLSHDDCLAWEHFQEFKDSTQPWSSERAQLTRDFFSEMQLPMPTLAHPSLYSSGKRSWLNNDET